MVDHAAQRALGRRLRRRDRDETQHHPRDLHADERLERFRARDAGRALARGRRRGADPGARRGPEREPAVTRRERVCVGDAGVEQLVEIGGHRETGVACVLVPEQPHEGVAHRLPARAWCHAARGRSSRDRSAAAGLRGARARTTRAPGRGCDPQTSPCHQPRSPLPAHCPLPQMWHRPDSPNTRALTLRGPGAPLCTPVGSARPR